jgi:toxin ParE1/3/4
LDAIYAYIAQDSAVYALRTVDRITARSRQIGAFPRSGRRVPEYDHDDVREVFEGPYRIIYRITDAQLDVIAVIHGARELGNRPSRE